MENKEIQQRDKIDEQFSIGQFILRIVQGFLIGGGAIIPGISGGVLCVAFGIYQPMMALISHPFKTFRTYIKMFIPIIIGVFIGFFGFAGVVNLLYNASEAVACSLFAGLVAGTIPSLFKDAGKKGITNSSRIGFVIVLFVLFGLMSFLDHVTWSEIEPNSWWFLVSGVLWGLSLIVPGLSSSSIIQYMGLYEPMTSGVKDFDFGVIIPLFAGIGLTALLLARFVNYVFNKNYSLMSHMVLGVIIASTLMIMPESYVSVIEAVVSIIGFFGGFMVVYAMDKFGDRIKKD